MLTKWKALPVVAIAVLLPVLPASAQNFQNWLNNAAGQIQQDASSGLINQNQATQLQNREAQIQAQQQQYLNQNGGTLTPAQQAQIGSELSHLNRRAQRDIQQDNPNLIPANMPAGSTPMYPQQYRNWNGYNPNYPPSPYNVPPQSQTTNGYPYVYQGRHHHHHGQWNGQNGQWNGQNGQYWGR